MGFRTKFCVIAGPIVLAAGLMQAIDSGPAPVKREQSVPDIVEAPIPIAITEVSDGMIKITNNTDNHIWMMDFIVEYSSGRGAVDYSDPARVWDIPVNQSREVDIDFDYLASADHFRIVDENITILADNEWGNALAELGIKRNSRPMDLTEPECYALRGYAPEMPCDGFKVRDLHMSKMTGPEIVAALEFIEDGTMDYASEISGK